MEAVEFLKEYKQICKKHTDMCGACEEDCPIMKIRQKTQCEYCIDTILLKPIETVHCVEQWVKNTY